MLCFHHYSTLLSFLWLLRNGCDISATSSPSSSSSMYLSYFALAHIQYNGKLSKMKNTSLIVDDGEDVAIRRDYSEPQDARDVYCYWVHFALTASCAFETQPSCKPNQTKLVFAGRCCLAMQNCKAPKVLSSQSSDDIRRITQEEAGWVLRCDMDGDGSGTEMLYFVVFTMNCGEVEFWCNEKHLNMYWCA